MRLLSIFIIAVYLQSGICHNHNDTYTAKVVIIGAGISGLTAAKELLDQGVTNIIIVEGSDRVGGRVRSANLGGYDVEQGALWIHGGTPNPLYNMTQKYGIKSILTDYEDYIVRDDSGKDVTDEYDEAWERFEEAYNGMIEKEKFLRKNDLPDMSQRAALLQSRWNPKTPVEHIVDYYDIDYEFAVSPSQCSTKYRGEETYTVYTNEDYMTTGNYSHFLQGMANEMFSENDSTKRLFLDTVVAEVHQNDGKTTLLTKDGPTFEAEYVICTVSLGVLQHEKIKFTPELPQWKKDSISGFDMNHYLHFYLQFPSKFWDSKEYIMFTGKYRGQMPVWINFDKFWPGSNIIQGVAVDKEALRIGELNDTQVKAEAMEVLRLIYGNNIPEATGIVVPRFSTDPLFMGMYSNWPPNFSTKSLADLKANVGSVHFAGDYMSPEFYGYMHGSMVTAKEIANNVLTCMKKSCPQHKSWYQAKGCIYSSATNYNPMAKQDDGTCKLEKCPVSNAFKSEYDVYAIILAFFISLFL